MFSKRHFYNIQGPNLMNLSYVDDCLLPVQIIKQSQNNSYLKGMVEMACFMLKYFLFLEVIKIQFDFLLEISITN